MLKQIESNKQLDFFNKTNPRFLLESQTFKPQSKPFLKWAGGKRQLINQYKNLQILPPNNFNYNSNYFEPFLGGGAIFFHLNHQNSFLSDLNEELVITYNAIKNNVLELISSLKCHKNNLEYFKEIRSLKISEMNNLEIASRFIYLNKTCFNGMYRVNKSGQFNTPFGNYENPMICDIENLLSVSKSLKYTSIKHSHFREIKKFIKTGDFIYFDPPYDPISKTSQFTSYTKFNFSEQDQIELRDFAYQLSKSGCYVMLSNSDTNFINSIYSELPNFKIHKVFASRSINSVADKRGKINELVITNY